MMAVVHTVEERPDGAHEVLADAGVLVEYLIYDILLAVLDGEAPRDVLRLSFL